MTPILPVPPPVPSPVVATVVAASSTSSWWANLGHGLLIAFQGWLALGHPGISATIPVGVLGALAASAAGGNALLASPLAKSKGVAK